MRFAPKKKGSNFPPKPTAIPMPKVSPLKPGFNTIYGYIVDSHGKRIDFKHYTFIAGVLIDSKGNARNLSMGEVNFSEHILTILGLKKLSKEMQKRLAERLHAAADGGASVDELTERTAVYRKAFGEGPEASE